MYKLVIVEDEPIEREVLKLMATNNCGDLVEVLTANNGFVALDIIKEQQIDIVIIDINMPGMNGLDTIKEIRKLNTEVKFIILSSYGRFEYAREAVALGVEDFILKPARVQSLKNVILKTIDKIKDEVHNKKDNSVLLGRLEGVRPIVESDCIYSIIIAKEKEEIIRSFELLGYSVKSGFCFVVKHTKRPRYLLNSIKTTMQSIGLTCIGEQFHNFLVFFLLSDKELDNMKPLEVGNFLTMFFSENGDDTCKVGVGMIQRSVENFRESYHQAINALEQVENEKEQFSFYSGIPEKGFGSQQEFKELVLQLMEQFYRGSEKELNQTINSINTEIILKTTSFQKAKANIYHLLVLLSESIQEKYICNDAINKEILSLENIMNIEDKKELELYIARKLEQLMKGIKGYRKDKCGHVINQVLQFINENYAQNFMLEDVATELGFSTFHLSKLINKSTGKHFTDLLAEKRIEEAKILLRENKSIKEVTYQVGFNSQNYFTKIFKKYVGVTPSEFKIKY